MNHRLPVALNVSGRRVVVVGGGQVAARKIRTLLEVGARVELIAPRLVPELEGLVARGNLLAHRRPLKDDDLTGAWLVFALTDCAELHEHVAAFCERHGIWYQLGGGGDTSSFWSLAHRRQGSDLLAASGGGNPRRALELLRQAAGSLGWGVG